MQQIILFLIAFFIVQALLKTPAATLKRYGKILLISILGMFFSYLLATGRLNWFFAFVIMTVTFLIRLLPAALHIMPHWPSMQKYWMQWKNSRFEWKGQQERTYHAPSSNTMSREEAYDVLGLTPQASSSDIISAHRKLMQKLHPDRGGSAYLAAKINLAKKTLLP
ncbi:MAG TPA: molecular chaperone DnaJ [Methylococcaceae bacterium]|nr:molecular chaperone DnaJ [Methylococcaceae bacterium]